MPQELTPVCDPALLLEAELMLWLSGGRFRAGVGVGDLLDALAVAGSLSPAGAVVGSVVATYATSANLTTIIPDDDTVPTITEGTEILSVTIAPKTTTNKLRCRFSGFGTCAANTYNMMSAMYQGSTCIDASALSPATINAKMTAVLEAEYVPGALTAQTISVRVGPGLAGTVRFNGNSAGRLFGGAANATLVVEEIKA